MPSPRLPRAEVVAVLAAAAVAGGLGEALRLVDPCAFGDVAQPLRLLLGLAPLPLAVALGAGRARALALGLTAALLVLALVPRPGPGGTVDCLYDPSAAALTTPLAWSALVALDGLGALLGLVLRRRGSGQVVTRRSPPRTLGG